jgi:antitoxin ParD1/3/4
MQLTIKPEHERIIEDRLRTGAFQSADEVVGRALELLAEHEQQEHERVESLRRDLLVGVQQAERGECTPWDKDAFLKRMHQEHDERRQEKAR